MLAIQLNTIAKIDLTKLDKKKDDRIDESLIKQYNNIILELADDYKVHV